MPPDARAIPRRELVTLLAYVATGSHSAAAHHLGISVSTSRQRVSQLIRRVDATNAAQAVWRLRHDLEAEGRAPGLGWRKNDAGSDVEPP
jgi:DNA-binding NarL/FixJ family response regulator